MTPEELQVAITFPGMIDRIPIRNLCPKRPWVFGQRMECQSIKSNRNNLAQEVGEHSGHKSFDKPRCERLQDPRQLRLQIESITIESSRSSDPRGETPFFNSFDLYNPWSVLDSEFDEKKFAEVSRTMYYIYLFKCQ